MSLWALQPPAQTRILVTGATGNGKSVWCRRYVERVRRVLAWDAEQEFAFLGAGGDGRAWLYVDELERQVPELRTGVVRVAVRPRPGEKERGEGHAHERFCRAARRIGNVLTLHEEVSGFAGASPSETYPEFHHLIVRGRHDGVAIVVTGQRLFQFPTTFRDNVQRAIVYRLPNRRSARALEELLDSREDAERALRLAPFHFLDWTQGRALEERPPLVV